MSAKSWLVGLHYLRQVWAEHQGPMCARSPSSGCHLRHSSDESSDSDKTRRRLIEDILKLVEPRLFGAIDADPSRKGERGAVCATGSVIDSELVLSLYELIADIQARRW